MSESSIPSGSGAPAPQPPPSTQHAKRHPLDSFTSKLRAECQETIFFSQRARARGEAFEHGSHRPLADTLAGALLETDDMCESSLPAEWRLLDEELPDKVDALRKDVSGWRSNGRKFIVDLRRSGHRPGRFYMNVVLPAWGSQLVWMGIVDRKATRKENIEGWDSEYESEGEGTAKKSESAAPK